MRKRALFWVGLFFAVLAVAGLLVGGSFYLTSMQQSLWLQSVSDVLEVTEQGCHAFEVYLSRGLEMLAGRAENFAIYSSDDEESILMKLDLYDEGDTDFAVVDLTHGIMYFNSEERTALDAEQLAEYEALSEQGVREPYLDEFSGQRMVGYYERFTFKDGAEGLVQKGHRASEVANEFSLSFYNDTGFSYVVNTEGDILLRSNHKNSNRTYANVLDVIEMEGNSAEDIETFRKGMSDGKRGVMRFTFDGVEYVFAFVPIDTTDGWYLLSIIPNSSILHQTDEILKTTQTFIFVVGFAILIFALLAFLFRQYRRSVRSKEAEVQYREQLFSILASNTDEVFLMLSSDDFSVEYVSPNVERVLGVSREDAKSDLKNIGRAEYTGGQTVDYETLKSIPLGGSATYEGDRINRTTGENRWFSETVYHSANENYERFIAVLSDRTVENQKEHALSEALDIAEAANKSKSAFLSNMSHDIRTPMNAIVGLCTLLSRDAESPEKVREHTKKITASSQHLLGLINDVLDMSKIESGKTTLNIGEIDLAEIVDELNTIMHPQAKAKNQDFEIFVYDVENERLLGDQLRINQVLINILSNAVKYTPEGGEVSMTVRQIPIAASGYSHLRFTVKDNGIGMSEEYVPTIFQPFSREVSSVTNQVQGTGLGMAITKNLVDLMGGSIAVESAPGQGSTFTVDLELRIAEQDADGDFWREHGLERLLVVDDEEDALQSIVGAMDGSGVEVDCAQSGAEALEKLRSGAECDLVLLDWKMPVMDGLEASRHIRAEFERHIPIIILTSYDSEDIERAAASVGVDGFMRKPFFLGNFKQAVRNLKAGEKLEANVGEHADVLKGKHFLAAEDNELNTEILVELLDMMGATCAAEPDGKAALERFENSKPGEFDTILMDVQMPIMNGYEATRAIRASSHPQAKTIPIVAMTANAFADDVADALAAGMDAHVAKPVDMGRLEELLKEIFAKQAEFGDGWRQN